MNCKKLFFIAALAAFCAAPAAGETLTPADEFYLAQAGNEAAPDESAPAAQPQPDLEIRSRQSANPLMNAAQNGDAGQIRALLADGAKVDAHGKNKITPLMAASLFTSAPEAVKALIDGGANVNAVSRSGWTPLMFALYTGEDTAVAETLLRAGAEVNAQNADGWTPLMFALRSNTPREFIETLISDRGAYPEARAKDRTTPMMIACEHTKDAKIIELLYDSRAEIALPRANGDTPLHFAARNPTDAAPDIIRFLVEHRADVTAKNNTGATPLMTAAQSSTRTDVIDALLSADWHVNAKKNDGMTALMLAAGNPTPAALDIAKRLEAAGADFETTDKYGRTASVVALRTAHSVEMVRQLRQSALDHSARKQALRLTVIPIADRLGEIARHYTAQKPQPEAADGTQTVPEAADNAEQHELVEKIQEDTEQELPDAESPQEPTAPRFGFAMKANGASRTSAPAKTADGRKSEIAALSSASLAARHISDTSLRAAQIHASEELRPFAKRRALKKLRVTRKTDPVLIPPLLMAAVNPTGAAPDIIAYLLETGEKLEACDTDGRTALICAVRYNSSPLAARALLQSGANPRVAFKKSSLRQLLRYNKEMENADKVALAQLIIEKKKK